MATGTSSSTRYGLAMRWQVIEPEARQAYPHIDFDRFRPAERTVAYECCLEKREQHDVALAAGVTDGAVSLCLSRISDRLASVDIGESHRNWARCVSGYVTRHHVQGPPPWATTAREAALHPDKVVTRPRLWQPATQDDWAACCENDGIWTYQPAPVLAWPSSHDDLGEERHRANDLAFSARLRADGHPGFGSSHRSWAQFVTDQIAGARSDVRNHFTTPPAADYYSSAEAAGLLFKPLATETTDEGSDGVSIIGPKGQRGLDYVPGDRPARDTFAFVREVERRAGDDGPSPLAGALDEGTLRQIRRMSRTGASAAIIAARFGVPEERVRIVTGDPPPAIQKPKACKEARPPAA